MNLTTLQQLLPKYQMATFCFQLKAIPPLNCIVNRGGVPESERVLAVVPNDEGWITGEGGHGTNEGSGSGTLE